MRLFFLIVGIVLLASCDSSTTQRDRHFLLGNKYLEENDIENAISHFDYALKIDPNYAQAYNNRGVAKAKKNWHSEAIQDFNEAIRINNNYSECIANRAFSYEKVSKLEKAKQDYIQLTTWFPDSGKYYLALGSVEVQMHDFESALKTFNIAKEIMIVNPEDAIVNLSNTYYFKGDFFQAYDLIRPMLSSTSASPFVFNTASLIKISTGEFQEALKYAQRAVNHNPKNGVFVNNLGYCYLKIGNADSAIYFINQSIRLEPQNSWAIRNKGLYYHMMKDTLLAIKYLETAKKMNPQTDSIDFFIETISK